MIVIADSSALVALSICQVLPQVESLLGQLCVPESVCKEVTIKGKPEAEALKKFLQTRVKPVNLEDYIIRNTVNLGSGE